MPAPNVGCCCEKVRTSVCITSRSRTPVTGFACMARQRTVIDGVFDATPAGGVVFHAATGLEANAIAQVRARVRRRLLRVFVRPRPAAGR